MWTTLSFPSAIDGLLASVSINMSGNDAAGAGAVAASSLGYNHGESIE